MKENSQLEEKLFRKKSLFSPPTDEFLDPAHWPTPQTLVPAQLKSHDVAGLAQEERLIAKSMDDSTGVFEKFLPVHKQRVCTGETRASTDSCKIINRSQD